MSMHFYYPTTFTSNELLMEITCTEIYSLTSCSCFIKTFRESNVSAKITKKGCFDEIFFRCVRKSEFSIFPQLFSFEVKYLSEILKSFTYLMGQFFRNIPFHLIFSPNSMKILDITEELI